MHHVVMFSGGIGSWAAAKRVVEREGNQAVTLLFADTLMEDEDLYRFLNEAAENVGAPLVRVVEGRTPWEVFEADRFIGNTRADSCSKMLKRRMTDRWIRTNFRAETVTMHVGIDWTEAHRYERLAKRKLPWRYEAPLMLDPPLTKPDLFEWLARESIKPPRLYEMGFPHNNCGGFCIKAGHAHFKLLLERMPERYAYHEAREDAFRAKHGDAAILRDRSGGVTTPLPLRVLRERIQSQQRIDEFDFGGCGCFVDE